MTSKSESEKVVSSGGDMKLTYIQAEFFTVMPPSGTINPFLWIKRKALEAFSSGTRMKYSVRVAVDHEADISKLLLKLVEIRNLNSSGVVFKIHKVLGVSCQSLKSSLTAARKEIDKAVAELVKKIIASATIESVYIEDVEHRYSRVSDEQTLKNLKNLLCKNNFNLWLFLCSASSLGAEEQDILASYM